MKNLVVLSVLLSTSLMTACGSGGGNSAPAKAPVAASMGMPNRNLSVDPSGRCTQPFVADYNNLVLENKLLNNSISHEEAMNHVNNLNTGCDKFFANNAANVSCTAPITYNGSTMTMPITGATVKNLCDQVKQTVAGNPGSTTTTSPVNNSTPHKKTNPKAPKTLLTSLQGNQLSFQIMDVNAVMATNGGSDKYLQNGKVVSRKDLDYNGVFCKPMAASSAPQQGAQFTGKNILKNPDANVKMNHVVVSSAPSQGQSMGFLCATGSNNEISVSDFQKAMKNVVTVTVNNQTGETAGQVAGRGASRSAPPITGEYLK